MYGASAVDAYDRIAGRAQDLREACRPGGIPLNADVAAGARVLPSTDPTVLEAVVTLVHDEGRAGVQ